MSVDAVTDPWTVTEVALRLYKPGGSLFRPISVHYCHQKPNTTRETVLLKPWFSCDVKLTYRYGSCRHRWDRNPALFRSPEGALEQK